METQIPPKGHHSLLMIGPYLLWLNGCIYHNTTWYEGRPRPRRHCIRWRPNSPPRNKGIARHPTFGPCLLWPNVWMDQDATWYAEVNLGPGDVVLDGIPAPYPLKGAQPQVFGPCLLWPNAWMDQDATWCGSRPRLGHIVLDGDPAPPLRKGHSSPLFSALVYCDHGRPSQLLLSSCNIIMKYK